MRILRTLFIVFLLVLFSAGAAFYVYIHKRGKQIVEERFSRIFEQPVTIQQVTLAWPLSLLVEDVRIGDVFSAEEISFNLSFLFSSSPQIVLTNMVVKNPSMIYVAKEGAAASDERLPPAGSVSPSAGGNNQGGGANALQWNILVKNLSVVHGRFEFRTIAQESLFKIEIKELSLRAENVAYPLAARKIPFEMTGRLNSDRVPFSGSTLEAHGWVNFLQKDMDARLKLLQSDGSEGVLAQVKSAANDMVIAGKVNVGLLSHTVANKPVEDYSVGDFVLGAIKSSGIELVMDFSVNTRMDHIRFDKINFSGDMSVKDTLPKPAGVPGPEE